MHKGNRAVGDIGEGIAARFLSRKGYEIIGRNVKTFVGEIDIVARKDPEIVFVEVKTRRFPALAQPYASVTVKKQKKLIQCALCYISMKGLEEAFWRIDVISIEVKNIFGFIKTVGLEHFENAVTDEWGYL